MSSYHIPVLVKWAQPHLERALATRGGEYIYIDGLNLGPAITGKGKFLLSRAYRIVRPFRRREGSLDALTPAHFRSILLPAQTTSSRQPSKT